MTPQKDEDFHVIRSGNESLPADVQSAIRLSKDTGLGYKLVDIGTGDTYGYVYLGNISRPLREKLVGEYGLTQPETFYPRPECQPQWLVIESEMEELGFRSMEFVRKDGLKSKFYVAAEDMPYIPKIFRKINNKARVKVDPRVEPPVKYPQFETMQYPTFSEVSDGH